MEAPIVAVTVYPRDARITRRGQVRLGAENRFLFELLPLGIAAESVRANGFGPASIIAVEVATERHALPPRPSSRERRPAAVPSDSIGQGTTIARLELDAGSRPFCLARPNGRRRPARRDIPPPRGHRWDPGAEDTLNISRAERRQR